MALFTFKVKREVSIPMEGRNPQSPWANSTVSSWRLMTYLGSTHMLPVSLSQQQREDRNVT